MRFLSYIVSMLVVSFVTACGGGGGSPGLSSSNTALFSTAPASVSLPTGTSVSYPVSGGAAPYAVVTDAIGILGVTLNESTLSISALASGSGSVFVTDTKGAKVTIAVTVPALPLASTAPSALTLNAGASVSYPISGGVAPYSVVTDSLGLVTASVNQSVLNLTGVAGGVVSVFVSDSKGDKLTIAVTVPQPAALFTTAQSAITVASGMISTYSVAGGTPPYVVTSNNVDVVMASVGGTIGQFLDIKAVSSGSATVQVRDSKGALVTIAVTVPAPASLFTTAPSTFTLVPGASSEYIVTGGVAPYQAISSNTSVVSASINGAKLTVGGVAGGAATVVISDAKGSTMSVAVTVSTIPLRSTSPAAITIAANSIANSFSINGGTPPYVARSSDESVAVASVPLGSSGLFITGIAGGSATVVVSDSLGAALNIQVTVPAPGVLFTTAPANVTMAVGASGTYSVSGGTAPYAVSSSDSGAVRASIGGSLLSISAASGGSSTVKITDSKGNAVSIAVTVGSSTAFFVNTPATLAIGGGTSAAYQISGGTSPYTVTSSDARIVNASVGGATLLVNAIKSGSVTLYVYDSAGASKTIAVDVDGSSGTGAVATIDMFASSSTLSSAPGSLVTLTVNVKDGLNVAVPKQNVAFSATNGGTLFGANPAPVTDANGTISTVTLSPGSDASNRIITVSAAVGGISKSISIPVIGTKLSISGVGSALAGTPATPFTVKALDSGGKPISGATLSISSTAGNGISPATVVTDVAGSATASFTPSVAGSDTVKVSGLGATEQTTVVVSNEDFAFTAPAVDAKLPVNVASQVTVCYKVAGVGLSDQVVSFSTTRGTLSATTATTTGGAISATVTTPKGCASTTVNSTTAGPVTVSAQLAAPLTARTSVTAAFVATVPSRIDLQANPGSVPPNVAGATTNKSALTATVRDATGNPVSDVTVDFTAIADLSNGSLSAGSMPTNQYGQASVDFRPGALSTATNGVTLQAKLPGFTAVTPATATLTVSGESLFISIGVASDLIIFDTTTYQKNFTAYLTDAAGAPSANRTVTLSVIPTQYGKGSLVWDSVATVWKYSATSPTNCANEDANKNGILESGEDTNGDGRLTPGLPVVVSPASITTDATGYAKFSLLFGKNFAWWLDTQITARASVGGTESKQISNYSLELDAATAKSESKPPNQTSPFGTATVCTNSN